MKKGGLLAAMAIASMNSTINLGNSFAGLFGAPEDPRAGMHPTRNDINRHGRPVKKKKGTRKQKTNAYK